MNFMRTEAKTWVGFYSLPSTLQNKTTFNDQCTSKDKFNLPKPFFGFLRSQLVERFLLLSEESFVIILVVVFAFLVVMFLIWQFAMILRASSPFRRSFDGFRANSEKTKGNAQCAEKFSHFARIINKQYLPAAPTRLGNPPHRAKLNMCMSGFLQGVYFVVTLVYIWLDSLCHVVRNWLNFCHVGRKILSKILSEAHKNTSFTTRRKAHSFSGCLSRRPFVTPL